MKTTPFKPRFQIKARDGAWQWGLILVMVLAGCAAEAATKTWLGNAANDLWSTASNWSPAGVPQDGDALAFAGVSVHKANHNDLNNLLVHSISFSGTVGGYSISGNPIRLESDITDSHSGSLNRVSCYVQFASGGGFFTSAGAGALDLNGDVILSGGGELALFCGGAGLTVSGSILGQGSVIKYGLSPLTLAGNFANDFTGPLTIREGTNYLAKAAGVTAVPCNLILGHRDDFTFGQVVLRSPNQIADTITNLINHGSIDLNGWDEALGAIDFYDGGIQTGTGTLTLLAPVRQRSWIYVRQCWINGTIYSPGDTTFQLDDDDGFNVRANITGPGGLVQNGRGVLLLVGTNTFAGPVSVNGGGLTAGTYLSLGAGSQVTLNGGGLELYPFSGSAGALGSINKQLVITSANSWFSASGGDWIWGGNIQLNFAGVMSCNAGAGPFSSASLRIFGGIQGTGGIWFGGHEIELLGNNTFTGPTVAACALLSINNGNGRPFSDSLLVGGDYTVKDVYLDFPETSYTNPTAELRWYSSPVTTHPSVTLLNNALVNLNGRIKQINQLNFNGGRVVTGAGRLYVGSVTSYPDSTTAVLDGYVTPTGANLTFDIADGPVALDFYASALFSDLAGVSSITKRGAGEMLFPIANAYDGVTTVEGGLLRVGDAASLGTTGAGTVVSNGATLQVEFSGNVAEPLTLTGGGRGGTNGALVLFPGTGVTAPITLNGGASVRVDSSFSILSGVIGGTGSFAKIGAGTLQFGGSSGGGNTFSGDTLALEGTLVLFKSPNVDNVPGNLVIGDTNINEFPASALVRLFNHNQIGGKITVNRGGLLDLFNFDEYCGDVRLNGGGDIQTGTGTLYLLADGVNLIVDPGPFRQGTFQSVITGRLGLSLGTHRFIVGRRLTAGPPELDVQATITEAEPTAHVIKEGFGTMRWNAANNIGGNITIDNGQLIITHPAALGAKTAGTFVNNGGSLALEGGLFVQEETLTLNSTNPAAFVSLGSVSNTWVAPITLQRTAGINVPGPGGILNIYSFFDCCGGSYISGPGGLTKTGPGKLLIAGFYSSGYDGPTTVNGGTLEAVRFQGGSVRGDVIVNGTGSVLSTVKLNAFATASQLSSTGRVTVLNGGVWNLGPDNGETVRALTGNARVNLGSGASLTVNNAADCEFTGTLSGTGALNKRGPATFKLPGDSLAFTGPATVSEGTYWIDGLIYNSPVTVGTNAILRGDGFAGNVTTDGLDSRLIVDSKTPARHGGDLEVMNLSLVPGSVAAFDFSGPSANGGNDSLVAYGSVVLNNAGLGYTFNYPPREGDVLTVLRKESAGPISGTFGGWPEGITRTIGGLTVRATYLGGNGNDFTLTVTNTAAGNAGYRLAEGNGNQTVEPNECNLLYLSLVNRRVSTLNVTNVVLRSLTPGVVVTIAGATYPAIPAGATRENLTPFQFRTDPAMACGTPVEFELTVGAAGEGVFAVAFNPVSGNDCAHPTGGCESCFVSSGQFTTNTPALLRSLNFVGGPSLCFPTKPCPQTNFFSDTVAVPYLTHRFINSTTNELCLTAQLRFGCPGAATNVLGAAAYLGTNIVDNPCGNYLGDTGADGTQPFSFRVPPKTNFVILVSARDTNVVCDRYTLELFGLPCPDPRLQIARDATPNRVLLQWSTASPGFTLQATNALRASGPSAFSNVNIAPVVAGGRYTVTNSLSSGSKFYRLRKP